MSFPMRTYPIVPRQHLVLRRSRGLEPRPHSHALLRMDGVLLHLIDTVIRRHVILPLITSTQTCALVTKLLVDIRYLLFNFF